MKALILAAGYAVRLYPLTKEYPKPLLKINRRPLIDYIIEKLKPLKQVDEIFIVTNSKFIGKFKQWLKSVDKKKKITLIDDLTKTNRTRRGAIGDIDFAIRKQKIADDLLVIGGDNLFSQGLKGFVDFAQANQPAAAIGLFRLKNKKDACRYGVVKLGREGLIKRFAEKPDHPESNLVAMCLYFIPRSSLGLVSEYMRHQHTDATGGYIAWLKGKIDIYGFIFKGSWFDIGDHKYLNAAIEEFAKN